MQPKSATDADFWRGTLIVLALVGLTLVVFLLFAFSGTWRTQFTPRKPPPVERTAERKAERKERKANASDDSPLPPPGASSPPPAGGPQAPAGTAGNATDALRQALDGYRRDPTRTTTVSITTTGGVKVEGNGDLSVYDGLPARAVREGTVISGGSVAEPANGSGAR
jgi:hypothetical protein